LYPFDGLGNQEAVRSFEKAEKLHMRSKGKKTGEADNAA